MKTKKIMYIMMIGYGMVVALAATLLYGWDPDIYIGCFIGIGSLMLNYWLLMYVIEGVTMKNLTFSVIPIGLGRFLIFGAAGWFCYKQSHLCAILFAISILAMPVSAMLETLWEVKDDSY